MIAFHGQPTVAPFRLLSKHNSLRSVRKALSVASTSQAQLRVITQPRLLSHDVRSVVSESKRNSAGGPWQGLLVLGATAFLESVLPATHFVANSEAGAFALPYVSDKNNFPK